MSEKRSTRNGQEGGQRAVGEVGGEMAGGQGRHRPAGRSAPSYIRRTVHKVGLLCACGSRSRPKAAGEAAAPGCRRMIVGVIVAGVVSGVLMAGGMGSGHDAKRTVQRRQATRADARRADEGPEQGSGGGQAVRQARLPALVRRPQGQVRGAHLRRRARPVHDPVRAQDLQPVPHPRHVVPRRPAPLELSRRAAASELAFGPLGDHTWYTPVSPRADFGSIATEIASAQNAIEKASGRPVTLFRPPYGARTP